MSWLAFVIGTLATNFVLSGNWPARVITFLLLAAPDALWANRRIGR